MSKKNKVSKKNKINKTEKIRKTSKINKKEQITKISETNKINIKQILICFILSRIFLILFLIIRKDNILELFDSVHYINIAKYGYVEPHLYAFFPLYPMLIKILTYIIPSYKISGLLISNICSFLSIIVLSKLTKNNSWNVMTLIFTPILAYTSIIYTESIFMLLTLLGYYLYKNNKYFLSGVIVGLSMLTRNSGIILGVAIGIDMLYRLIIKKEKEIKFKHIIKFIIPTILIGFIYSLYLYIETGNMFEYITVQTEYWNRLTGTIFHAFINDIKFLKRLDSGLLINLVPFIENWLFFILTFILGIKLFKKDKVSSIYLILSLIAITTSYRDITHWGSLASISLFRYILNLFPIYLYIYDNKKESTTKTIFASMILLSVFNTILIFSGAFLA